MITTILIGTGLALLWSLLSGTYCKRKLIPIIGLVGILTVTWLIVLSMEFGVSVWIQDITVYAILIFFLLISAWIPLLLLFYAHKNIWTPRHLLLLVSAYSLFTVIIYLIDILGDEIRIGFSLTSLAFAVFGGIMAVRDHFSLSQRLLTPICASWIAYLPIAFLVCFIEPLAHIPMDRCLLFLLAETVAYIVLSLAASALAKLIERKNRTEQC